MCERAKSRNKEEIAKFLFAVYYKDRKCEYWEGPICIFLF